MAVAIATVLLGGASPAGAAPAAPNPVVTVSYEGSYDATSVEKISPTENSTAVSHVDWDLSWTGQLQMLLSTVAKQFTIETLTGKGTLTQLGKTCTTTFSPVPSDVRPGGKLFEPPLWAYRNPSDTSQLVISVGAPIGVEAVQSDDPSCVMGASIGAPVPSAVLSPSPKFDLAVAGSQIKHFNGSWKFSDAEGVYTTKIVSTVSFSGLSNYVALGDSYSSGQVAPFIPGGTDCARSVFAYPELYDPDVSFWACSGATIAAVEQDQLPHLQRATKLVTITVGGDNTSLFGDAVTCLLKIFACKPTANPPAFAQLRGRLADLYEQIHERAPLARIFVLGYPNPLPATVPTSGCEGLKNPGPVGLGLEAQDIAYFYRIIEKLNATVRLAVADSRVATYISPDAAFAGHDICSSASFFFPLSFDIQAFHPDRAGQAELAELLLDAAGPPPE